MLKIYLATTIFNRFFEDQLDEIRVQLYEETKDLDKEEIVRTVNAYAQKIAHEFGITVSSPINEKSLQAVCV